MTRKNFVAKHVFFWLFLVAFIEVWPGSSPAQSSAPKVTRFINGNWFTGSGFAPAEFYSVDGVLAKGPVQHMDESVDLHGGYVIPPFGDAHEHNFDSVAATPAVTAQYLRDGIFYAQGVTDVLEGSRDVVAAKLVNTPQTVDVTYAHGGLTGINGHPKEVYEAIALGFYYPANEAQKQQVVASHLRAGSAYWEIDSPADLAAKWPAILATKPDLIKIYMSNSDHYTPEMHTHPPFAGGLDPALVPLIVARAHVAKLKVAAHIDTAADYHVAVAAGVDEMAHMPGYCLDVKDDPTIYHLADADIALAARHHTTVVPTAAICDNDYVDPARKVAIRSMQLDNLRRLKAAGVVLLVGSDHYGQDALHEATYLYSFGLWSNLEFLRMWAVATPQDIFPKRRIGRLEPGYDASFLVLDGDPIKDWAATGKIEQRWKQGHQITIAAQPAK